MVTARELVVLSGLFTSGSMSVRRHRHFTYSYASHERYTASSVEGQEINHKSLPHWASKS